MSPAVRRPRSGKGSGPSKRRAAARPTPPPSRPPLRPTVLRDATEDLADVFEESLRHLLLSDEHAGWTVGPVRLVSLAELDAGTLGWSASIVALDSSAAEPHPQAVGEVFLLVLPNSNAQTGRPAKPPLSGRSWEEFSSVEYDDGPPRLLLLARSAGPAHAEPLRGWTRSLLRHLLDELS